MVRFCSSEVQEHGSVAGQILKKLGFRLDFLLTVAVKCVPATGLRTTLDPSQGPLKNVAPCFTSEDRRIAPSEVRAQLRKSGRLLLPSPPCFSPVLVLQLSAGDSSWEDSVRRTGAWGHSKEGKQKGCLLNSVPAPILYLSHPASFAALMVLEFLASGICQRHLMPSGTHCKNVNFCLHRPCNCRYSYGS